MIKAFGGTYAGRTVLVTGHTGFKGSWLALWLNQLGAKVIGVSLDPPTEPSCFAACGIAGDVIDLRQDIRDYEALRPYVCRLLAGEGNVLTRESPFMFATTSGTTGEPKHIPVTPGWARDMAQLMRGDNREEHVAKVLDVRIVQHRYPHERSPAMCVVREPSRTIRGRAPHGSCP